MYLINNNKKFLEWKFTDLLKHMHSDLIVINTPDIFFIILPYTTFYTILYFVFSNILYITAIFCMSHLLSLICILSCIYWLYIVTFISTYQPHYQLLNIFLAFGIWFRGQWRDLYRSIKIIQKHFKKCSSYRTDLNTASIIFSDAELKWFWHFIVKVKIKQCLQSVVKKKIISLKGLNSWKKNWW